MNRFGGIVLIALLAGCPGGASGVLTGKIVATREGVEVPVADAQVRVWPSEPGARPAKFEAEAVQNLRGVSITRSSGRFEIASLTSSATAAEYPLLKGWTYVIEVEVPGFYITSSTFEYGGGSQYIEMEIEEKRTDVLDTSGGVREDDKQLHRGAIRKD
jgi:hypothetical protein